MHTAPAPIQQQHMSTTHSIYIHNTSSYSNSTCQQHAASTYTTPAPIQQQHMSTMARTLNNGTCSICIHTSQYTTPSPTAHLNKTRSFCMHSTSTHSNSTQNYNTHTPTDSTATAPEATSFKATTLVTALITLYHKIKT